MDWIAQAFRRVSLPANSPAAYAAATALVGIGVLIRLLIAPVEAGLPFVTLFPAVFLACVVGGIGPAAAAILLSAVAGLWFLPPYRVFEVAASSAWAEAAFAASAALTCVSIELLRATVRRLEAEQARNRELLRQKDLLVREVDHRVKNSLQVVSGILALQSAGIEDEGVRRQIDELKGRIEAIAAVHETLYGDRDLSRVGAGRYLARLIASVEQTYRAPGAAGSWSEVEAEEVALPADRAVPFGLLVNELLTNALKHAYPGGAGGPVRVSLARTDDGAVRLAVADEGVGLPTDFDPRRSRGLGMRLITSLVRQLGGTLEVERPARGTRFVVTMPLAG